jgi:DNA polymerase-3 subunit alpha
MYGTVETVIFPKIYERHMKNIEEGRAVIIKGRAQAKDEQDSTVVCNDIKFLENKSPSNYESVTPNNETLWIKVPKGVNVDYNKIMQILQNNRGNTPVIIYDERTGEKRRVNERYWIDLNDDMFFLEIKNIVGEKSVVVK